MPELPEVKLETDKSKQPNRRGNFTKILPREYKLTRNPL